MKKQLGLLTSLIVLCATALCWSGCNRYRGHNDDYGYRHGHGYSSYVSPDNSGGCDGGSYSPGPTSFDQGAPYYDQGSFNQGTYNQGPCGQGSFNQGPYNQVSLNQGPYIQGTHDQVSLNQGPYIQGAHDQVSLNQGPFIQGPHDQGSLNQGQPYIQGPYSQGPYIQGPHDQGSLNQGPFIQGPYNQGPYGQVSFNQPYDQGSNIPVNINLQDQDAQYNRGYDRGEDLAYADQRYDQRYNRGFGYDQRLNTSYGYDQRVDQGYNRAYDRGSDGKPNGTRSITTDGVTVTASQPKLCILGDNYVLDLCVQAHIDVCHVEVNAMLPEGVTLVRSEPEGIARVSERGQLSWLFESMKACETRHSRVTLKADKEGNLRVCFCVTAVPVQFCQILCAKPILECSKCGPAEACPGDPVHYVITVTNTGTCTAEDVVVTDNVPDGLEHSSGLRTLTFKLGNLEPCQTKKINACFTAVKRGKICNRITATACNATPVSCEANCSICKECVELIKVGPKEVPIGKNAEYQITVANPGDKSLTDVVLTDQAPAATSIVEAKGACVNCNTAVWKFCELKPGEKQTVNLVLTTCTPGYFVNKVCVDNCQRCRACAEAGTRWKGRPSLSVCLDESDGPICVGEGITYTVRVSNQGSEEDRNVNVVIRFPNEVVPVSASGDAHAAINGNTVTFQPIKTFGPRQVSEFRVEAQARSSGDARIRAEVSSDTIRTPIVQEESTIVN